MHAPLKGSGASGPNFSLKTSFGALRQTRQLPGADENERYKDGCGLSGAGNGNPPHVYRLPVPSCPPGKSPGPQAAPGRALPAPPPSSSGRTRKEPAPLHLGGRMRRDAGRRGVRVCAPGAFRALAAVLTLIFVPSLSRSRSGRSSTCRERNAAVGRRPPLPSAEARGAARRVCHLRAAPGRAAVPCPRRPPPAPYSPPWKSGGGGGIARRSRHPPDSRGGLFGAAERREQCGGGGKGGREERPWKGAGVGVGTDPSVPLGRLKLSCCMIPFLWFFGDLVPPLLASPPPPSPPRSVCPPAAAACRVRAADSTAPAVNWRARGGSCHLGNKKFPQGAVSEQLLSKGKMRERGKEIKN